MYISLTCTGNRYAAVLLSENVFMQILSNGTFSVDTYFFTSGFLLSFVFLKAQKKQMKVMQLKTKVKQFFSFIIKRYIRYCIPMNMRLMLVTRFR